jgi:hypothetical protein
VLITHFFLCVLLLRASPRPVIDVFYIHRASIDALLHGRSAYHVVMTMPGRPPVQFGYPYPPLTLLFAAVASIVCGDFRYAWAVSMIASAALIGYSRPGRVSKLAAAMLLTQPRGLFVLEQAWTEPAAVALLAAALWFLDRRPLVSAWLAGWLVTCKQYLILGIVPFFRAAIKQRDLRPAIVAVAMIAAAAVIFPFLWQDRDGFLRWVVFAQAQEPFRPDSLSYLAWAARHGLPQGSMIWAQGASMVALAVAILRTPNTRAGVAATVAFSMLVGFAFGSKAFCNYYYFVIGAWACAFMDPASSVATPVG